MNISNIFYDGAELFTHGEARAKQNMRTRTLGCVLKSPTISKNLPEFYPAVTALSSQLFLSFHPSQVIGVDGMP